jgi:hypothetical protein
LLLPFIFSYLRGDSPPQRAFVNLTPAFALLLGTGITLSQSKTFVALVLAYCLGMFCLEQYKISSTLFDDLQDGKRSHNLYYNYYLQYYHPNKTVNEFPHKNEVVMINDAEPHDITYYLEKYDINYKIDDADWSHNSIKENGILDSLVKSKQSFYAITRHPFVFKKSLAEKYPGYNAAMTSSDISYYNFMYIYPLIPKDLHH